MTERLCKVLALTVLVTSTGLIAAPAAVAAAVAPPPPIDFPGISNLTSVASANDRFYVAAEAGLHPLMSPDAVLVIGFDGTLEATIGPIPNIYGVAVHDDVLYVTVYEQDEIWRYDLTTDPPTKLGETSVAPMTTPDQVVVTGGRVWFDSVCNFDWSTQIGSMALDGTDVEVTLPIPGDTTFYYWRYCADLDGTPVANRLFLPTAGLTPAKLTVVDVTVDPPTSLTDDAAGQWAHGDFDGGDLAPLPGGTTFAMDAMGTTGVDVRRISDFTLVDHYDGPGRLPRALAATTANGGFLAEGFHEFVGLHGITIWETGVQDPVAEFDLPGIVEQGLAFNEAGTLLAALTQDGAGLHLYRIDPLAIASTLTLSATPPAVDLGDPIDLDGVLTLGGSTAPGGRTITLTREDPGGSAVTVGSDTTAANGSYHLQDTPPGGGTYTYRATFAGAGHVAPAAATDTVDVIKPKAAVSIQVSKRVVRYGGSIRITGHLGAGTESRILKITARFAGGGQRVLASAPVDADGDLAVTYRPPKTATYVATFSGDAVTARAQDSVKAKVRLLLHAELIGSRSTSGDYEIYRRGSVAKCNVRVEPRHARARIDVVLQAFVHGRWVKADSGSFRLTLQSRAVIGVRGSSGVNLRVRVSTPSHADHLGDSSPWLFLRFA